SSYLGGLEGLQTASIIAAAPFLVVMVGLCISLWMALLDDLEGRSEPVSLLPDAQPVAAAAE
ncbi:glycine/betaine ABC transporter permease, partial [Mesorhizobium sp. M8A.F.Ca.ET.213.01.1.1]|uniref:BCCT family transporter n=1 Tax=Mesorhizobium sp. M8A.F.Ca.ET.213.01.1.1 TaxID=2563970 RepID=UPI00113CF82F